VVKGLLHGYPLGRIFHQHSADQILTAAADLTPLMTIEYQLPINRLLPHSLIFFRTERHMC